MPRTKRVDGDDEITSVEVTETPVQTVVEAPESEAKQAYRAMMEAYAKQNPAKYELKREAMEAKLNTL